MGRAQDHEQEGEGHHHLADQRRDHAVTARRLRAIAVAGETGMHVKAGSSTGYDIEHARTGDASYHLGDHVGY